MTKIWKKHVNQTDASKPEEQKDKTGKRQSKKKSIHFAKRFKKTISAVKQEKISGKILKTKKNDAISDAKAGPVKRNGHIRNSLIYAFMIPVGFIVLLGILSYQTASRSVQKQYRKAVSGNVVTMADYSNLLCETIEAKANEFVTTKDVTTYYSKFAGSNESEAMKKYRDIKTMLTSSRGTCDYMNGFYVFSPKGGNIISATGQLTEDTAEEFEKTQEAKEIQSVKGVWTGYHNFLDERLSLNTEDYALSYTKRLQKNKGVLCMDITKDTIDEMLNPLIEGKGSYAALVTSDGREVLIQEENAPVKEKGVFVRDGKISFEQNEEEIVQKYVRLDGKKYLYTAMQAGKTGIYVCSLVPSATILNSASMIRLITILVVVIAGVAALLVGTGIANKIAKEVKNLILAMKHVSEGDFTAQYSSTRTDEFGMIADAMDKMLCSMRGLMGEIIGFSEDVSKTSEDVFHANTIMADSMHEIDKAMEAVAVGTTKQATDTENSLSSMNELSGVIDEVYHHTDEIQSNSQNTMKTVEAGKEKISLLHENSQVVARMATELVEQISIVGKNTKNVGTITSTIQEIAEQTNLLSLNASIEAARAGEAGRGFSVVAGEIRKLAEQSAQAGKKIEDIISNIESTSAQSVESVKKTAEILEEQKNTIKDTVSTLSQITDSVEEILQKMDQIGSSMEKMIENKDAVLTDIGSIAEISEQSAATTQEVTATVNERAIETEQMADDASKLRSKVASLREMLKRFTV